MKNKQELNQGRRAFLRRLGMGAGAAVAMTMMEPLQMFAQKKEKEGGAVNRMTYRVQHGSGEQISLLGFGMMRLPDNQDEVNALVDYAIEHGVNYFDTAPMYMGGRSEVLTGNALSRHPREKYYVATKMSNQRNNLWDFAQIQMNFLDWRHASSGRRHDADAEYLYNKCEKTGVQCVVMEPLRGGAFGRMAQELVDKLKAVRPNDSAARWAFRWVGSYPNILTTLSGMNRMDHLKDNLGTFSPLENCSEAENRLLADIADEMAGFPTIPCTTCGYCMPCPYGVDIPGNFAYYNDAVHNHVLPLPNKEAADFMEKKQQFTDGMRKALPDAEKWARSCQDCEECLPKCPQQIRIPNQLARIVETLRRR